MNRPVRKTGSALFPGLLWLLLSVPLTAATVPIDTTGQQIPEQASTAAGQSSPALAELIDDSGEAFSNIDSANLDGLLARIGDSRLVLLGEASHGTAEFYNMRARITRELIEKKGFTIIAAEADWPDAESIDHFVRGTGRRPGVRYKPFSGFPSWMWANQSVSSFVNWLKAYNQSFSAAEDAVRFYGLDFYNIFGSIDAVLDYLHSVDPAQAEAARWSYGCLRPWADDPSQYGRAMRAGRQRDCGYEVFAVLQDMRKKRQFYLQQHRLYPTEDDVLRYFTAVQNARLVINAERFYRTMFYDNSNSWNQRDQSMFETLLAILHYHDPDSKVVIWAHNSHIGDSRATDRRELGEINLGQRVRETFADSAYLIGFGTDHGTVAAATEWGAPMTVMQVPPAHKDSYERLFHEAKADNFLLPLRASVLRHPSQQMLRKKLLAERLQRAIGTAYDPDDELNKHYSRVSLPRQFDEYIWFDETVAVEPLSRDKANGVADTYPSGL